METLVIGIDGGEWDAIAPLIKDGELPNLDSLVNDGISGNLTSSTPPVSAPAWNSILTGTNPGKHGIFDFVSYTEDYQHTPNNASDRTATPFWTVLNDHNIPTGLFKVPFTYPAGEISGFTVSGFPKPQSASDFTYPRELNDTVGPVSDLFENGALVQESRLKAFRENLDKVARHQTDGFIELLDDFKIDLGMIVFDTVDRAQHTFWKCFDEDHPRHNPNSPLVGVLKGHYKVIDKQIGRILEKVNNDCDVIVLSDHGFRSLTDYIYIDEWLEREGFLSWESSKSSQIKSILNSVLQSGWKITEMTNTTTSIKSIMPSRILEVGRDLQTSRDIKWNETEAFFSTVSGQSIFVNVENRFIDGTIEQSEYDDCLSAVKNSLNSLEHPETGEPVIESVFLSERIFEGEQVDGGPDLIVIPKPGYALKGGRSESLFKSSDEGSEDRSGDHRPEGILIASGPSFRKGKIKGASITDIAPTLLYLHQVPIPKAVDGRVLEELFDPDVNSRFEKDTTDQYGHVKRESHEMSNEERSEVESRLEEMGYL